MMGFHEFKELCQVLNSWKTTFSSYDQDRSGTMEGHELQKAIACMGTAATPRTQAPEEKLLVFLSEYVYVQVII